MIILIYAEKSFEKNQYPFMIETLNKLEIGWKFLSLIKRIYPKNPTAN